MSYADHSVFEPVAAKLRLNKEARLKRGALVQDFPSEGRMPGEVFYGNLDEAGFEALPLKSKRKGEPARATRIFSEQRHNVNRVFTETYENLYGDKTFFAVYVHTYELDILGIEY